MKKILLIALLILTSCASQNKMASNTNVSFSYNWQIADGTLIINFANYRGNSDFGSSREAKGLFKTNCRQTYLDFIKKLQFYGNQTNSVLINDRIDGLEFNTLDLSDYLLLEDSKGRIWKINKSEALILADKLSLTMWINLIPVCPEIICVCE